MIAETPLRSGSRGSAPSVPDAPTRVGPEFDAQAVFAYLHAHLPLLRARPPGEHAADKAACEIALLCWGLSRNAALWARLQASADDLLDWADTRLRGSGVLDAMLWQPARLPMFALGDGFLAALQRPDPMFRAACAAVHDGGLGRDAERSPYQTLEVAFAEALAGYESPPSAPMHWLAQAPFLPLLSVDDGYAFTHALFYLTRFGRVPLPQAYAAEPLHGALEAGLWWCVWRRDFDLLAEMLLCALFIGMPATAAVRTGIALLRASGRRDGHLSAWEDLPAPRDSATRFFQHYHPLLVAALLDSELALRDEPRWPVTPAVLPVAPAAADALAALGIAASREQLDAVRAQGFDQAIAEHYGEDFAVALPRPEDEDWRIVLGFVRHDPWTIVAATAAQLQRSRITVCTRHARRWLETLAPVVAARNAAECAPVATCC